MANAPLGLGENPRTNRFNLLSRLQVRVNHRESNEDLGLVGTLRAPYGKRRAGRKISTGLYVRGGPAGHGTLGAVLRDFACFFISCRQVEDTSSR